LPACAHTCHSLCYKYLEWQFADSGKPIRSEFENVQMWMKLKVIVAVTVNIGMSLRVVWWMCAAVSEGRVINDILMMEAMESSETSLHLYQIARRYIPQDSNSFMKFCKSDWKLFRYIVLKISHTQRVACCILFYMLFELQGQSHWPFGLRYRPVTARLARLWVRIPPGEWMSFSCECCVMSGRGLCDELITLPEESYGLLWVVYDLEPSWLRRI
jgi:hypothetical protein